MTLDLRRDFAEVYQHLADRVRTFDPVGGNVLGGPGPVRSVDLGFEYSQDGWLVVSFDCRADAEPDGEWTHLIEANRFDRPHWQAAGESEWPVQISHLDGRVTSHQPGDELAVVLGDLLKAVLLQARTDRGFDQLPNAEGCQLGVEHLCGAYGWPQYEDRGRDNLA